MPQITKELLDKTSDDKLDGLISSYTILKIYSINEKEKYLEIFGELPLGVQTVYATNELEMEVHNGGFAQYFWNRSGLSYQEAIDGYQRIGAPEHAKIVEEAFDILGEELPIWGKYIKVGTLEAFAEYQKESKLNFDLAQKFFRAEDKENTKDLRVEYIRANSKEFITDK